MDEPLLRMEGIRKVFSGVVALDGVDFQLERGEVHALVGENGAGKSTLSKIMTGAYRRDGGRALLEGREVNFRSPEEAQAEGVVAVYQEVNLLAFRTVAENIFLGREPRRMGFIDWKRMNSDADAEIVAQIRELIETRVRPAVAQDGGDIVYRGFREGKVYLALHGACSGCPSSTMTLKQGIESLLKHYVPEVETVEAV